MTDDAIITIVFFTVLGVVFICWTAYGIFDRWMEFKERQLEEQPDD